MPGNAAFMKWLNDHDLTLELFDQVPTISPFIIKNVSSSTSHKKTPSLRLYVFPSFFTGI